MNINNADHITDKRSELKFLIDNGADISLVPKGRIDKAMKNSMQLFTANNVSIKTYGERLFVLNLGLRRPFKWTFCVADVSTPIIGADFFI